MIQAIPEKYRLLALAGALVVAGLAGAAGGAVVATWRAELACAVRVDALQGDVARLTGTKHDLELAIAEQNQAVAVAEAQTRAAEAAKAQAEQLAGELATLSRSRMTKLEQAVAEATSCDAVLRTYWDLRK